MTNHSRCLCSLFIAALLLTVAIPSSAQEKLHKKGRVGAGSLLFITETLSVKLKSDMWRQRIDQPLYKGTRRTNYNTRNIAEIKQASRAEILQKENFKMMDTFTTPGSEVGMVNVHTYGKGHDLTAYRVRLLSGRHAGKTGWIYGEHMLANQGGGAIKRPVGYKIILKSGRTLSVDSYRQTDDEILIRQYGGTVGYERANIESIEPVY